MRNLYFTLFLILAVLLSACQPIVLEVPSASTEQEASSLAAQEAEVRAASAAWDEAFNAADLPQLMALYAEDAVSMPPNLPALEGKTAIEGDFEWVFDNFTAHHQTTVVDLEIAGDLAVEQGEYTMSFTPKDGSDPFSETGKHIVVRKKSTAGWQVIREIWNTHEPAAADNLPMFYTSHGAHENLGMIDLDTGAGTHIGRYQHPDLEIARSAWFAPNGAVYHNDFYTILNKRLPAESKPEEAEARLARVDMQTGELTLLGDPINLNLGGLEISPCGEVFAAGFSLTNAIGALYGDTNLYRVDPQDASLTLIGDTGLERIMDLAFDPAGTLWATVGNVLYTLDQETGTPTEKAAITGVEEGNEIMGIAFTSDGMLYGTSPWVDGFYAIDPVSGVATEVGRHGFEIVHGGDIPMVSDNANCE